MEIVIAVAMVLIFVAGRKSVRNRLDRVENATEYQLDVTYDEGTRILTVNRIFESE